MTPWCFVPGQRLIHPLWPWELTGSSRQAEEAAEGLAHFLGSGGWVDGGGWSCRLRRGLRRRGWAGSWELSV